MCLCKIIVFTFSNRNAFRRLEHKLNQLNEELGRKCYPIGIVYIVKSHRHHTPEERDRLFYEELFTYAISRDIKTSHIHFNNWKEYKEMRKQVGKQDVFGILKIKVV